MGCCGGFSVNRFAGCFIDVGRMENDVLIDLCVGPGHHNEETQRSAPGMIALLPRLQLTPCSLGFHEMDQRAGPADDQIGRPCLTRSDEMLDHSAILRDAINGVALHARFAQFADALFHTSPKSGSGLAGSTGATTIRTVPAKE